VRGIGVSSAQRIRGDAQLAEFCILSMCFADLKWAAQDSSRFGAAWLIVRAESTSAGSMTWVIFPEEGCFELSKNGSIVPSTSRGTISTRIRLVRKVSREADKKRKQA
jgi:hypothetical protein